MSGQHVIKASRSHARAQLSRLAWLLRGHGPLPAPAPPPALPAPAAAADTDVIGTIEVPAPLPAPPWEPAVLSGTYPPARPDDQPWRGITLGDGAFPPVPRPYVDIMPSVETDLGELVIFRDTVRAVFVRQEEARGFCAPHVPWPARYAGLYRARTAEPVPDCVFADGLREAHAETRDRVRADVEARMAQMGVAA